MYLIGLDIGTTGCKTSIFTVEGKLTASAWREYRVEIPFPNWAEQDAELVWKLAQETIREAYSKIEGRESVVALGLSCQGEAVTPVDRKGNAIRKTILGMDTRTDRENEWLVDHLGSKDLFKWTGMPVHTINTLPKLLWIRNHEPEIWRNADKFLLYEDFIINKMTGNTVVSRCLASRTQLYNLQKDSWSTEILNSIDLDPARLSMVQGSGQVAGTMRRDLADSLGLPNTPIIASGGHDQACGALGVGLSRPGISMVSTGTAEVVEVALDSPGLNSTLEKGNISVYAHVIPGLFLAMTLNHSGGLVLRWFRDTFCGEEVRQARLDGTDPYDLILKNASPEPSSLLLLPHFSGSGTPHFDTSSKGVIAGLTFGTTKSDIAKAIIEGLTFELKYNLEVLQKGKIKINELRAIGGGARSEIWLQMKADVTGIPVVVPKITEAASWGAAILGGVAAGCYRDAASAADTALSFEREYQPNSEKREKYLKRYKLYKQVYPKMNSILHGL